MHKAFFFIGLLLVIFYILKNNFRQKYLVINFNLFFTLGIVYYFIIPCFYFFFLPEKDIIKAFVPIYRYAQQVSGTNKMLYIFFIYVFYFAFVLSSEFFERIKVERIKFFHSASLLRVVSILLLALIFYLLFRNRHFLFKGYLEIIDTSEIGPLVSTSLILFSIFVMISIRKKKIDKFSCIAYVMVAFLILSMGGRLYFISTILSILSFIIIYKRRIKIKYFFLFLLILLVIFSSLGLIRQGNNVSLDGIVFIFLGEPFFTSYSLFSFLALNELPFLEIPNELMFGFINLIPTYIFPGKSEIIKSVTNLKYQYVAPLGALNLFVSCIINFGLIGSILFISVFSFVINYSKKIIPASFIMIFGWLAFTFFRDPFTVSLVKNIFQYSLLTPLMFYLLMNMVYAATRG
jgi:hypothetical protein